MDQIKALESKESKEQVANTLNLSDFEKLIDIEDKLKDLEKIKDSEISQPYMSSAKLEIPYSAITKYIDIVNDE